MGVSRRNFLAGCGCLGTAAWLAPAMADSMPAGVRTYHLSITPQTPEPDPEVLQMIRQAGVSHLWLTGAWCGEWICTPERLKIWRSRIEAAGMQADVLNMPLGHPGCAIPKTWHGATSADGKTWIGTSLHEPATKANCDALRQIEALGARSVFLDDDFRLAASPGGIGGCFCPVHKQAFLRHTGYAEPKWQELCDDVAHRKLTPVLRDWVSFNCDQLTECFRTQQKAVPGIQLGVMVMYLGSEKAGIRLTDYRGIPMRVGEYMFSDDMFDPVKGKTDELFSSLFHRRFMPPELAYSETTAFPDKRLSLKNKVAKLAVSTLSDVRNTMFMCDFPKKHWPTLAPAMKRHADIHARIAGHRPRGPLKHFWGTASRFVGDDNPYSLFLALGIPFEVVDEPAHDGFTFLSDADAETIGPLRSARTVLIARPRPAALDKVRFIPESLPVLLAFKKEIVPKLGPVPYVEGDSPIVCAWYPTARAVVLWNLAEQPVTASLRCAGKQRTVPIEALNIALAEDI